MHKISYGLSSTVLIVLLTTTGVPAAQGEDSPAFDEAEIVDLLIENRVPLEQPSGPLTQVDIPETASDKVAIHSPAGSLAISLPTDENAPAEELSATGAAFRFTNGTAVAAVESTGGVQIVGLIAGPEAPEEYSYELSGDFVEAEVREEGTVFLWRADGSLLGGFFPAWARDASGNVVATHYRLDGRTLIQVVEHQGISGIAYPITADPKYGSGVLSESKASNYSGGGYQVSAWLSAWGRAVYFTDSRILATEGWSVLKNNHWQIKESRWKTSLAQQWDCHIAGGWLEWSSWDLETKRPSNAKWRDRIANNLFTPSAVCNW